MTETRSVTATFDDSGVPPPPPPPPLEVTGEIWPSSCSILEGDSDCEGRVWWESTNTSDVSVKEDGSEFSTNANQTSPGVSRTLDFGLKVFKIFDVGNQLDMKTVDIKCEAWLFWLGGVCQAAPPTISANPVVIEEGDSTELSWIIPVADGTCTIDGGTFDNDPLIKLTDEQVVELDATTTFTIDCGEFGSDSVKVEVQPKNYET